MSETFDIAVVGGGMAGIAAAVCAARAGKKTLLLDQRLAAGGTGGYSGLTTLCGLFDDEGKHLNDGFPREFAEAVQEAKPLRMGKVWVLQYRPEKFREVAIHFLNSTPNLQTQFASPLAAVVEKGNRIVSLNNLEVSAVIDCSGSAEVACAIGAQCLKTDEKTQAPAVIFPLHNVCRELNTAPGVAQVLLPLARAGFPPLNFQTHLDPDTITVKFSGPAERVPDLINFLQKNIAGFENCFSSITQFAATERAGRMILGQYLLTSEDVLAGKNFPDAVARCAWPIEQWSADGVARFKYLRPKTHYEIPARSLRAASVENLFMAGKTISADVDAIASARVMGCCLATGAAAGNLAATYLESSPIK